MSVTKVIMILLVIPNSNTSKQLGAQAKLSHPHKICSDLKGHTLR
jgi:hypothetical protein